MSRNRPEQTLQTQMATFLGHALHWPDWFTAIGHGGGGKVRGAILKGMGVKAGVADILVLGQRKSIWLECKSKDGRQSPEQKNFQRVAEANGHIYTIVRSLEQCEGFLLGVGVPLHATTGRAAA